MRVSIVTGLFVLFGVGALAGDETPLTEASLQKLRLNSSSSIPSFIANGGTSSFQINFIDHLVAVAELEAKHRGNIHYIQLDNTEVSNHRFCPTHLKPA